VAHTRDTIGPADFVSTDPDRHPAEAGDLVGQLHPAAPQLERQQAHEPASAFLIKSRQHTINRLVLSSDSTISMFLADNAFAMMKSTTRFRFAHGSGPNTRRCFRCGVQS
jgi:hypothetical protein